MKMLIDNWIVNSHAWICAEEMDFKLKKLENPETRRIAGILNREKICNYFDWNVNKELWDGVLEGVYKDDLLKCIGLSERFLKEFPECPIWT
jgi:hypothetical protein